MSGFNTVHLRITDLANGQPTPVRLRIAGPRGELYAPLGRSSDFPVGRNEAVGGHLYRDQKKYTYIDGQCEIQLPTDLPLELEISKGPEYELVRQTIVLSSGQLSLRYAIRRRMDWRAEGWTSADTRCHFLSPETALLEAACEDLRFVHLLATEVEFPSQDGHLYRTIPNMTAFSGQRAARTSDGHGVVVNSFNTHPALGRLGLLHCHRTVFPLRFGGGDSSDDWSLCDWADQCHRKQGLVVWCDAYRPDAGLPGGEALIAAILGKIDALEVDARQRSHSLLPAWYRLLNAGICLPLVGGSGKDSNRTALGSMRTYTWGLGPACTLADWVEQTRLGHTIATTGAPISLRANGVLPGSRLSLKDGEKVLVEARAEWPDGFDRLEIVANGVVMASAVSDQPLAIEADLPEGGWLAARCVGSARSETDPTVGHFAHTTPVFLEREGKPPFALRSAIEFQMRDIERTREWVETTGYFVHEKNKRRLLDRCNEALKLLDQRATSKPEKGGQ